MYDGMLTDIELVVIELARGEPPSSIQQRQSPVRRVFGGNDYKPLASPRLEALRRYAILRRVHGTALAPAEYGRLHLAGFDDALISEIDHLICEQNCSRRASRTSSGWLCCNTRSSGKVLSGRAGGAP